MTELQLPAHLAARQSRGVAATLAQNLASGSPPYISIKGSRFTLVDAAGNQKPINQLTLDVVIADMNPHVSKIYYENAYDPNATEALPPTCFSDNGVGPSSQAQKPQAPTCAACPNNVWGSDTSRMTGKATKACNDVQKLAVMLPDDPQKIVFLLRVPPASLKHLGKYAREVGAFSAGGRKVDVSDLVTRLSFDPNAVGILNFTAVGFIDEATAVALDKAGDQTKLVVNAADKPHGGEIAAPVKAVAQQLPPPVMPVATAVAATQTFPAAAVEAPNSVAVPAPAKRRGRPPKAEASAEPPAQAPFMQVAAPQQVEADPLEIPAFLQRNPAPAAPQQPAASFGMSQAQPASDEMSKRIAAAFALPTG